MKQTKSEPDTIRQLVRENYGKIANAFGAGCGAGVKTPCCSGEQTAAQRIGYSNAQIASIPDVATMGLGCGNPHAIARLKPGETVLDLGSGAGFDCFLAARAVGETGRVIGVDMTDEMIRKAEYNAKKSGIGNVTFRKGNIEDLPVADDTVDVIMSNCVINLSPEKDAVFREAYRVLKPGGRIAISDVVAIRPLPASIYEDHQLHCACIGGAAMVEDLRQLIEGVGFEQIAITPMDKSRNLIKQWTPGKNAQDYVVSALIEGIKPGLAGSR
jgi:SAM-dependent methyltransferase